MRENAKEAPWPYSKHILSLQLFLGQWRHIFFHFFHSLYEWKRMNIPCHVDRCWWHYDPCFWRDISSPITGLLDTVHSHRVRLRLQWRGMRNATSDDTVKNRGCHFPSRLRLSTSIPSFRSLEQKRSSKYGSCGRRKQYIVCFHRSIGRRDKNLGWTQCTFLRHRR
jgi:hypothetical protein